MKRWALLALLFSQNAAADTRLVLDLPVIDAPGFSPAHGVPGFNQSLALTKSFYNLLHFGYGEWVGPGLGPSLGLLALDAFTYEVPFLGVWLHEEWHRAVLQRQNISSHDGVYDFQIFSRFISVSGMSDEALADLKRGHPAEFVRLSAAGMESEVELASALKRDAFFRANPVNNRPLSWVALSSVSAYLTACARPGEEAGNRQDVEEEGPDISRRDFAGLDCLAWVYDLFRPTEPFEARGPHPSGYGIRRDRYWSDLTTAEKGFLAEQSVLSFLNFADPYLFGVDDLGGWTFHLRHHLAPFGGSLGFHAWFKKPQMATTFFLYRSPRLLSPGLAYEVPGFSQGRWAFTPHLELWFQPKALRGDAQITRLGGRASLKVAFAANSASEIFLQLGLKTFGWSPGVLSLESGLSLQAGASLYRF